MDGGFGAQNSSPYENVLSSSTCDREDFFACSCAACPLQERCIKWCKERSRVTHVSPHRLPYEALALRMLNRC